MSRANVCAASNIVTYRNFPDRWRGSEPEVHMQHLIVVAHPLQDSITMKLARAYALELQQLGHSQRTHDLYRMSFNPIMGAHELDPLSIGHAADADVAQAQRDVRNADAQTMIYPLCWATMPAMMKGSIDRVFSPISTRLSRPLR